MHLKYSILFVISYYLLVICLYLLVICYYLLVIHYYLLVNSYYLLVNSYYLLVNYKALMMRPQRGQFYSKKGSNAIYWLLLLSQIFYFRQLVLFQSNFGMFT